MSFSVSERPCIASSGFSRKCFLFFSWTRPFRKRLRRKDFARLGGNEGAEVIMWLIMRGALRPDAKKLHQNYYLPMTTAMAVALFE